MKWKLHPGEKLSLPSALIEGVGAGKWTVTIQPVIGGDIRGHGAFLNGYSSQDEGLYDDDRSR